MVNEDPLWILCILLTSQPSFWKHFICFLSDFPMNGRFRLWLTGYKEVTIGFFRIFLEAHGKLFSQSQEVVTLKHTARHVINPDTWKLST